MRKTLYVVIALVILLMLWGLLNKCGRLQYPKDILGSVKNNTVNLAGVITNTFDAKDVELGEPTKVPNGWKSTPYKYTDQYGTLHIGDVISSDASPYCNMDDKQIIIFKEKRNDGESKNK